MSNLQALHQNNPHQNTEPQSVLVIRFGAMGDLLHVSPSIKALKEAYPNTTVHFLTSPLYGDLVGRFSGVDHVWTFDKKSGWMGLFQLAQTLKKVVSSWDAIVNLHPSLRTYLLMYVLHTAKRVVYRKEKLKVLGLTTRYALRRHALEDFYLPFQKLWPSLPALSMPSLTFEKPDGQGNNSGNEAEWVIGVVPGVGAKRGNRSWPIENYEDLIQSLLNNENEDETGMGTVRIKLFGGPDEVSLCKRLQAVGEQTRKPEQLENHCARYSILETAQAMMGCDVLLAGDTGPLHLAAATGIEVMGLFGPTSIHRTGPRGLGDCQTLLPEESLSCWPCEKPVCPLTGEMTDACMKSIAPARVLNRLKAIQKKLIETRQSG